jgi:hypothetical protein
MIITDFYIAVEPLNTNTKYLSIWMMMQKQTFLVKKYITLYYYLFNVFLKKKQEVNVTWKYIWSPII